MATIDQSGAEIEPRIVLSDHERRLLMMAGEGGCIAAIAAHEKAIDRLVALGLMTRWDKFNNVISPSGETYLAGLDANLDDNLRRLINGIKKQHGLKDGDENPFVPKVIEGELDAS